MKKTVIISALAAAAGIATYLLTRKKAPVEPQSAERTHHLTNIFSKAKQHAINE